MELKNSTIVVVEPTIDDWIHVKNIWEDPATMHDVGGIHELPFEKYQNWFSKMFEEKKKGNKYFLIFDADRHTCLGEISFHRYDPKTQKAMFNIKIKAESRNKGVAFQAMDMLFGYYFNQWKGKIIEDAVWEKNKNGLEKLKNYGFQEVRREEDGIVLELDRERWIEKRKT